MYSVCLYENPHFLCAYDSPFHPICLVLNTLGPGDLVDEKKILWKVHLRGTKQISLGKEV